MIVVVDGSELQIGLLSLMWPGEVLATRHGKQAARLAQQQGCDVVIVGTGLGWACDWICTVRRVVAARPSARVIVLAADFDLGDKRAAYAAGASAYVPTEEAPDLLPDLVTAAHRLARRESLRAPSAAAH